MSTRAKTPPYSPELKQEILRLCKESGRSIAAIATEYGLSVNTIYRWRNAAESQQQAEQQEGTTDLARENRELRRRLSEAEQERDILKKAIGYFAQPGK